MQRILFIAIILLSSVLFSFSGAYCSNLTETEEQTILSDYQNELKWLNYDTDKAISNIGPVEFSSFSKLSNIENVAFFKHNLKKYWKTKRHYFDRLDALFKTYREKLGQRSENFEEGIHQVLERLEENYVADLNNFYDLILQYHDKMSFEEGRFYLKDERDAIELNTLWAKAVMSTRELVAALN